MTVLELSFPAGRFHATPWGRHVNEGAVEWPPSPWRIVRAFIATWYLKARDIPEATVRSLLDALNQPPSFRLPPAATAHTRHYMPYVKGKNEEMTKVFDTFIQLAEDGAVLVAWDITLPPKELQALRVLASRLGYLGRAESLVEARVLEGITGIEANATPLLDGAATPERHELVRVLSAMSPTDYEHGERTFSRKTSRLRPTRRSRARRQRPLKSPMTCSPRSTPTPGTCRPPAGTYLPVRDLWTTSAREMPLLPAAKPRLRRKGTLPSVARYAVVSTVSPRITQAISVGDRVHDALCKWSDQGKGSAMVFTGLDAGGTTIGGHRHAHMSSARPTARVMPLLTSPSGLRWVLTRTLVLPCGG